MDISNISFENIKPFIVFQFVMLLLNFVKSFRLEDFQYYEMVFGSIFIIVFFGIFNLMINLNFQAINDSLLFAVFFGLWYYCTIKITNTIHTDQNGVIRFT